MQASAEHIAIESLSGVLQQGWCCVEHHDGIKPQPQQHFNPTADLRQWRGWSLWPQHGRWMRVEGYCHGRQPLRMDQPTEAVDDRPMPHMDAIKVPDR